MKRLLKETYLRHKAIFDIALKFIDLPLAILVIPIAYVLLFYRLIGSGLLPYTTTRLKRIGLFPIRSHYYEPLFDDRLLKTPLQSDRSLPGLNLNEPGQLALLITLRYSDELIRLNFSDRANTADAFHFNNSSFEAGDAEFLYQLVRHLKPRNVIEIGSGNSTKIAHLALIRNSEETGKTFEHICVEPYENAWLERLGNVRILRERVEHCGVNWQEKLQAGDFLFVDSSHIIRPQGDVLKEYLEIFPSLQPGVVVHIHDIFTPKDYPATWVVNDVRFWNEQYLLEALLSHTDRYEVVAALNYLKHHHYDKLKHVCPYLTPDCEPGSFYFQVRR